MIYSEAAIRQRRRAAPPPIHGVPLTTRQQGTAPAAVTLLAAAVLLVSQFVLLNRFDIDRLFGFSLLDDSFYYFTIARNAASGLGLTFDGLTPTNGFHPLWMLALRLLWPLGGIKAGLAAGALLGALTVWLAHRLVSRATGSPWAGTAAALAIAANPALYVTWINGLETALALCGLTLFLLAAERAPGDDPGRARVLGLGLLAGAVTLARTDYALLVLPGLAALLLLDHGRPLPLRVKRFAIALVPFGLAVGGWVGWSWAHTGRLLQTSGMAIPFINTLSLMDFAGTDSPLLLDDRLEKLWDALPSLGSCTGFGWAFAILAAALVVRRPAGRRWLERGGRALPGWLLAGLTVTFLFHTLVRLHHRTWYYAPYALAACLALALLLHGLPAVRSRTLRIAAAAALVLAVALPYCSQWHTLATRGTRTKDDIFNTLRRIMERKAGPDAVVGISDAGYLGYTLPCRVINIDGVVNGDALEAMRNGRLTDYIRGQGMSWAFLRGVYFTPKVLGPDFEQWLAIGVFPPHPITFRVLSDGPQVLERFRLAGRGPVDLIRLENRHFLRHFGGDPANFYHENALFGTGALSELTLWLPPAAVPEEPGSGFRVMVELALGPDVGSGPIETEVTWAGEPLATVRVDREYRRYRFFLPREKLTDRLEHLGFRLQAAEPLRGRIRSLAFRTLRAIEITDPLRSVPEGNGTVEERQLVDGH